MHVKDLPKGHEIYTYLRHTTKSGLHKVIDLQYVDPDSSQMVPIWGVDNFPYTRIDKNGLGFEVSGGGTDLEFDLVYALGEFLHSDGYYFKHTRG